MKRLILFDIDETMISSDGAGRKALARALHQLHQVPEAATRVSMSGKTDPQILTEILSTQAHIDPSHIQSAIPAIIELYLTFLDQEILASQNYIMHDGVREILDHLVDDDRACLGLLTGNVEAGARKKLARFDLNKYFAIGAYGSDSADRSQLPPYAVARAREHFKSDFDPQQVYIIGDSVNDIACARAYGARVIAVNTGKTSYTDLAAHNPDYLLASLADKRQVLSALFD
ncbi:MAG: HAD hydrolase-like protein [Candidatus Obscuribacterales bacterium]|jgi:phosphoglycolate phosphatase|nr:HAD hydrolase-like protein [Candidatus Obscuribacterales bacterium]